MEELFSSTGSSLTDDDSARSTQYVDAIKAVLICAVC